jgi:tetratricopeptide (TPR) repeat protein
METLGELGIIGLLLVVGFVGTALVSGCRRSLGKRADRRWPYVAATASAAAFAVGAGIDWAWELSVLPVAFLVLAGGLLAPRRYTAASGSERLATRVLLIGMAVVAMVAIVPPLLGGEAVRDSQAAVNSGDLPSALDDAEHAHSLQPYAAAPDLQRALVLELMGKDVAATEPASDATRAASQDWRNWLVLSRLEAEAGRPDAAIAAYKRAKSLNPRSVLFAQTGTPK